jgi:phospholipid/cholesterol/gamma-HCH transport system ATP-binding protein
VTEQDHVVRIRGLSTWFGNNCVHKDLDLDIRPREVLGIVGGSGTGKSVLMRHMIMLTTPKTGSVKVLGQEVVGIGESAAVALRRRMGVMFQGGALFSSLTVAENVAVPLEEHTNLTKRQTREIALLKVVLAGLPADAGNKYPRQLSGGMIKRAAVARALALDPELLFLDEPSAGLDPVSAAALDDLILQLRDSLGLTVIIITHDLDSLWKVTDRVAFLGEKKIIGLGSMWELAEHDHPIIQKYFRGPRGRASKEAHLP